MAQVDTQSMRGFIAHVEEAFPEEVVRIKETVRTHLDMSSLVFELEKMGRSPIVVFEKVEGAAMPVVTNLAGSRKLLASALGVTAAELPSAFRERCTRYIKPELVDRGAWQDITLEGDDVDLTKLPIPFHFAIDAAPYITAGQITARDPESGVDTTGFHRLMLKGKNKLGVSLHSRRRMWEYHRRAAANGQNLQVAVVLGIHPLHYMGSMVYAYPPGVRKFEIIGALLGEPYRIARVGTGGLEVPAGAEIVIEGEILADEHEPEGPFGEFTGYASFRSTRNVLIAKRVHMRRDAMFHSVVSGMSQDHILVSCITREGEILNALRRNLPNVRSVHVPHTTCGGFMAFVSMKKTQPGEPQQAILAALGTEFYLKYVIVVDEDVDIFNLEDVMWALATRVQAEKNIHLVHGAKGAILDPTSDPRTFTVTKMGIDATKPDDRDFATRLTISDEQRARVRGILKRAGIG